MRTRTGRARAVAAVVACGWLGLVGRWLLHAPAIPRQVTVAPMELVWLASATAVAPPVPRRHAGPRRARTATTRPVAPHAALQAIALPAPPAPAAAPSADALRAQARAWAEAHSRPDVVPWADRAARLPARAGERFAMREPPSVARALGKIGKVFGGAGYDPDPCPRRRENVAALMAAGDSAALREEVDFVRRTCRP
ncbi:MAG TPA: hypothetical protein VM576_03670 [Xanthomonadaceae bacterium]|nr:hypothetical protein [Xanthomonadaceae bacterium]